MRSNYPTPCEDRVLAYEGEGYTDGIHPYDPGGPTKWGITIPDIPGATAETIKNLTMGQAAAIYKTKYWNKVRGDDLPSGLDETVFDYAVNSGVGRSGKVLRRCIGMPDNTSLVTDEVLAAIAKRDVKSIIVTMNDERLRFLQSLAIWPTYKNGWTSRVNGVRSLSLSLANKTPVTDIEVEKVPKGAVPSPKNTKSVIKTAGTAGSAVASAGFIEWIVGHPVETAIIAVAIAAVVFGIIHLINRNHRAKQEAPTPGLVPVPATGG